MFMVNFVPQGHVVDDMFEVNGYSAVKVLHFRFPDSCDRYDLQFLGVDGKKASRSVFSVGR